MNLHRHVSYGSQKKKAFHSSLIIIVLFKSYKMPNFLVREDVADLQNHYNKRTHDSVVQLLLKLLEQHLTHTHLFHKTVFANFRILSVVSSFLKVPWYNFLLKLFYRDTGTL